jgi:VanZ family protein
MKKPLKPASLDRLVVQLAVFTVGAMALFFNLYDPWENVGPERLRDGGFETPAATDEWQGWNELVRRTETGGFKGSPGVEVQSTATRTATLRWSTSDLHGAEAFRVSLRAAAQNVMPGKFSYDAPRALFFYTDAQAKGLFNIPHQIVALQEASDWKFYTAVFPIPATAVSARFYIQNLGLAGLMQADNLSVIPVRKRPFAVWFKAGFSLLWATAFVVALGALKPWQHRWGWLVLLTLIPILIGVTLPGKLLNGAIEQSATSMHRLRPPPPAPPKVAPAVRPPASPPSAPAAPTAPKPKEEPVYTIPYSVIGQVHVIGHWSLFCLLAFFCGLTWIDSLAWRRTASVLGGLLLFSVATEILQFIPPGRSATQNDLATDLLGIGCGVAAAYGVRLVRHFFSKART